MKKCKHKWVHYKYELDNYDRDVYEGYKCNKCDSKISVEEYRNTKEFIQKCNKEEEYKELQLLKYLKNKYEKVR